MNKRILWIEDQLFKFDLLIEVLQGHKIDVVGASIESEWEQHLQKNTGYFHLVILDHYCPVKSQINSIDYKIGGCLVCNHYS